MTSLIYVLLIRYLVVSVLHPPPTLTQVIIATTSFEGRLSPPLPAPPTYAATRRSAAIAHPRIAQPRIVRRKHSRTIIIDDDAYSTRRNAYKNRRTKRQKVPEFRCLDDAARDQLRAVWLNDPDTAALRYIALAYRQADLDSCEDDCRFELSDANSPADMRDVATLSTVFSDELNDFLKASNAVVDVFASGDDTAAVLLVTSLVEEYMRDSRRVSRVVVYLRNGSQPSDVQVYSLEKSADASAGVDVRRTSTNDLDGSWVRVRFARPPSQQSCQKFGAQKSVVSRSTDFVRLDSVLWSSITFDCGTSKQWTIRAYIPFYECNSSNDSFYRF